MGDLDAVLRVVRDLNERPEWKCPKEHRDDLRGERALPPLCVVGEPDRTDAVADALTARLNPDPSKFDLTPARLIPEAGELGPNRAAVAHELRELDCVDPDPTCTYRVQDSAPCP